MKSPEIKILEEENCNNISKKFWTKKIIVLVLISLGIPIIFIILNILLIWNFFIEFGENFSFGLNLGNSIALLSAGGGITGVLYSNHKNELRSEKSTCEAGNRITKQINNQNINLKKQLEAQEKIIKLQLIHADKQQSLLKIYDILSDYDKFIDTIQNTFENKTDKDETIISSRKEIFINLKNININSSNYYYLPLEIKKLIMEYLILIKKREKMFKSNNSTKDFEPFINTEENIDKLFELTDEKDWKIFGDSIILEMLVKLYVELKKELDI